MASSHRLPLPRFAERSCVCVSIGCYFLHVVLCSFLQTRTVVFSKLEIQPNGVDEGQCYPSFNWLAATSVVSYPSKIGIFQGIFLLGFYFTAGILFISLTMLEMMISLINDIFFLTSCSEVASDIRQILQAKSCSSSLPCPTSAAICSRSSIF